MMIIENTEPSKTLQVNDKIIKCYDDLGRNLDKVTVKSFGEEWKSFHGFSEEEIAKGGDCYFDIVTPEMLGNGVRAIDFGCGSGRWTKYIHKRVGYIAAVDPSDAIFSASNLLEGVKNVQLYKASIDKLPFDDNYFDFGFSLGVLHHIPDTRKAMKDCIAKIKPGGHFLVYLYYNLDNKGWVFKMLFYISNIIRWLISKLPAGIKKFICDVLAVTIYMPLIGLSRLLKNFGVKKSVREKIPLHIYEDASFYVIRNDSLDRFGTPLEQRFSRREIEIMMEEAGLTEIQFSENLPYWHAVGQKI